MARTIHHDIDGTTYEFPKLTVGEIERLGELAYHEERKRTLDTLDTANASEAARIDALNELNRKRGTSPAIVWYVMTYTGAAEVVRMSCERMDRSPADVQDMDPHTVTRLAFELVGFGTIEELAKADEDDEDEVADERPPVAALVNGDGKPQ